MVKDVLYQYLGTNGTILSPVHLEDIYYIRKIRLSAESGKVLVKNGKEKVFSVVVPEEEVSKWEEIPLDENEQLN